MRRPLAPAAALVCLVLALVSGVARVHAQARPGGVRPLQQITDSTPPMIWLDEPSGGETPDQYPLLKIEWCDDQSLVASSRWIKVNGVTKTSSFSYQTSGFIECEQVGATSQSTSVALDLGDNTIQAHICDNNYHCTTETWIVTRVQQAAPTVVRHNFNGDSQDRSLCLTVGAGQAAGLACGDLFVVHSMPAYRTMGRDRSLTLFYSSSEAAPRPTVGVWVSQPSGNQTPNSVFAKLTVNGVVKDSATFWPWSSGNGVRQLVLGYDASGDASGLYPFTLEVRNQYSGGSYSTTITDTLIAVNRSTSPFGAGWWLAGVEQLVLSQPGNKILWLDGDGSAAVYRPLDSTHWLRAAGALRDTLVLASNVYTRTLRHGVQVKFNSSGLHTQTINRTGQTTTFTWSSSLLTNIQVPPGGSGTTYTLAYDGASKLDYITDPASRVLNATVTSGDLSQLTDPDNISVSFAHDASHRITSRTSRRNAVTVYRYTNALRVDTVRVPLDSATTAVTAFEWWDEKGVALGSPSGSLSAVDTTNVFTKVYGPRPNVEDNATFWVDRWAAPVRLIGAVNDTSFVTRDSLTGLVSRYRNPAGQVWKMTYNARGNLLTQSDSTHEGGGTVQAATTRYTYQDSQAPDSPDSVIDPTGVVTQFRYDSFGLDSLSTAPTGGVTRFLYKRSGSLTGLMDSVTDLSMRTYADTVNWGTGTSETNHTTRFYYNTLGNLDSTRSPMGSVSALRYNGFQQVQYQISPVGDTTRFFPSQMGLADSTSQYGPSGERRTVRMTYDADFNRLAVADPRSVMRTWAFDAAGRDTLETDDFSHTEHRWYGPSGLLDSTLTRDSVMIRRTYDAAGRLAQIRFPARDTGSLARGDTLTFKYDVAGRLDTAVNRSVTVTRQYYREGTIRQEQQASSFPTGGGLNFNILNLYQYDLADRRSAFRNVPSGSTDTLHLDYSYTSGQMHNLIIDYPGTTVGNDTATYTWDSFGRRQTLLTPHHATVNWYYDLDGRLRRIYSTHDCHSTCVVDSAQVDKQFRLYDRTGRPLKIVQYTGAPSATVIDSASYDRYGQVNYSSQMGVGHYYTYDLSGNRLSDIDSVNHVPYGHHWTYNHNLVWADTGVDQAGSHVLIPAFVYSRSGNRLQDLPLYPGGSLWRDMWYDALGHMTSTGGYVYSSGISGQDSIYASWGDYHADVDLCKYDALGRRVEACASSSMAYDGNQPVWVNRARIVYGPGQDEPLVVFDTLYGSMRNLHYFITDGEGRLLSYTDSNGVDARAYSVYNDVAVYGGAIANGETFRASASESKYTPQLAFFRNRYYDTRTGRFTQEDPIGVAGGVNLYAYVGNNPVAYTDPFGLCIWDGCVLEFIAASTVAVTAIRAGANLLQGRPVTENLLRDASATMDVSTMVAPVGAAAGRVWAALDVAKGAESAALAGQSGAITSVTVASRAEANAAGRLWIGSGGRALPDTRAASASFGKMVGQMSADATRMTRWATLKKDGALAANLENIIGGSNTHVVVNP